MPTMLRSIFLVGLIIFSLPAFAQRTEQSALFDWDWTSSWASENYGPKIDPDEVEYFGPHMFGWVKGLMSADIGKPQPTGRFADKNMMLKQQLEATRTVLTIIDMRAAKTEMEKASYVAKIEAGQQRIGMLERELETLRDKITKLTSTNARLIAEKDELHQRNQQRLATLESQLGESKEGNRQLKRTNEASSAEKQAPQQPNSWIVQLLGYHRGYHDAADNVDVEATEAEKRQALAKKLKAELGRDVIIPDLAAHGVKLMGGHVLPISDQPTGRIFYEGADGNPLGLWFAPRMPKSIKVNFGRHDELNIVHWQSRDYEYALIGSVDWSEFALIAGKLYQLYNK